MTPAGLARSVFEDGVARRLGLDPEALRAELSVEHRPAGRPVAQKAPAAPRPSEREVLRVRGASRVRIFLPGPAVDAVGILAAYPELSSVAEEEGLAQLLPPGPLCDLVRELYRSPLTPDEMLARAVAGADELTARRVKDFSGPGKPPRESAERELRRALVKTRIEALRKEQEEVLQEVTRAGKPVPEELTTQAQLVARRRSDLEKRLRAL